MPRKRGDDLLGLALPHQTRGRRTASHVPNRSWIRGCDRAATPARQPADDGRCRMLRISAILESGSRHRPVARRRRSADEMASTCAIGGWDDFGWNISNKAAVLVGSEGVRPRRISRPILNTGGSCSRGRGPSTPGVSRPRTKAVERAESAIGRERAPELAMSDAATTPPSSCARSAGRSRWLHRQTQSKNARRARERPTSPMRPARQRSTGAQTLEASQGRERRDL